MIFTRRIALETDRFISTCNNINSKLLFNNCHLTKLHSRNRRFLHCNGKGPFCWYNSNTAAVLIHSSLFFQIKHKAQEGKDQEYQMTQLTRLS